MVKQVTYFISHAPPSLNNAYANTAKGRIKSRRYMTWINAAGWEIKEQGLRRVNGRYSLTIAVGEKLSRADIDNLIKPISDLLVHMGVTEDDSKSKMRSVSIAYVDSDDIMVSVIGVTS